MKLHRNNVGSGTDSPMTTQHKAGLHEKTTKFSATIKPVCQSKLPGIKLHDIKELFLIFKLLIAMFLKSSYLSEIDIRIW